MVCDAVNDLELFSENYPSARRLFLEAHDGRAARIVSHRHPDAKGPYGEDLFMDAAWFGPDEPDVVVLTVSGVHGAEGYCGSAMQTYAARRLTNTLPPGVALMQVHAANPFGMAHFVRTTEEGVDLSRNWVDFSEPPSPRPLYEEVAARLPADDEPDERTFGLWRTAFLTLIEDHGRRAVDDALTSGQYVDPGGFGFGGFAPTWSRSRLEELLSNLPSSVRHVAYLDWHSLLRIGDGELIFLCFNEKGGPLFARTADWWGEDAIARDAVNRRWRTGTAAGERRAGRRGLMMWGLRNHLAPRTDIAGAVVEFCTEPDPDFPPDDLWVRETVCERYLRRTLEHDTANARRAKSWLRRTLYPESEAFKIGALKAGAVALRRCLDGAGLWAAENRPAQAEALRHEGDFD